MKRGEGRMKIDHVGYAVKRMDRALRSFGELGFNFEPVIEDTDRNIRIAFGKKDVTRLNLFVPWIRKKNRRLMYIWAVWVPHLIISAISQRIWMPRWSV